MAAAKKKRENALKDVALIAGTQQNLSNLYSLDIYAFTTLLQGQNNSVPEEEF
jgi:hypothetical protein